MSQPASASPSPDARRGLRLVRAETERVVQNEGRLRQLARRAQAKLAEGRSASGKGGWRSLRDDVPVLLRLVRSYTRGEYRRLPWRGLLLAVGALVYFVTPADLIPDFIVGTGLLDDAAVVAQVLWAIRDELGEFTAWERENALEDPDTLSPPY